MNDLTREDIDLISQGGDRPKSSEKKKLLKNKVSAMMFFEPSTRTRTSFEAAIRNLGGKFAASTTEHTSVAKEESLWDTVKMHDRVGFDVIRDPTSPQGGSQTRCRGSRDACHQCRGRPQPTPTQTLLDLYSIRETKADWTASPSLWWAILLTGELSTL